MQKLEEIDINYTQQMMVCKLLLLKTKVFAIISSRRFSKYKNRQKSFGKSGCLNEFLSHKRIMVE